MVFSSAAFLFAFFPVYIAVVALVRNTRASNALLVVMSLLFYAWGEPVYILLMLLSITVNYLIALPAEKHRHRDSVRRRALLSLAVIYNLTVLALFKYSGFLVGSFNSIVGTSLPVPRIPLPVGISFFTFQTMSYVIDAYRGKCSVQRNFGKFTLYVSFFPQLIAGPIVKYRDIEHQLDCRVTGADKIADGIRRFTMGLSKKLLIANATGSVVDQIYSLDAPDLNIALAWMAAILYSLQIYFDFSGYSDMAIGLGKMAGFDFPENFNYPYVSCSLREFWKRWHISLTSWFREYVYFPLGGSRKGELRTGINRMTVFLLTGMWHGAMWTFVVWGAFHGIFQLLETYFIHPDRWKKPLAYLYTMAVVTAGFAVFRADSIGQAAAILWNMLTGFSFSGVGMITLQQTLTAYNVFIVAVALVAMTPLVKNTARTLAARFHAQQAVACARYAASAVLMALCLLSIASSSYNPFIYFRF